MKRPTSVNKGTTYSQTMLKNREDPARTWRQGKCHAMNEEVVVDEVEIAKSLTLSEVRKTITSKPRKLMALLCSVCDAYFIKLTEGHSLGLEEYLRGKVDLVLADPPYNV